MSPAKVLATPSLPSTSSRTAPGTGSAPRLDDDHLNVLRLVFDFLDGGPAEIHFRSVIVWNANMFWFADGDGELNDEELRVAVTTMGDVDFLLACPACVSLTYRVVSQGFPRLGSS